LSAPVGTIPVDAVFSPVKRVNYVLGTARVGQRTDYDKLTLEIWTDGSILPEEAIAYGAKIMKEQMNIFINFDEEKTHEADRKTERSETPEYNENLYRNVDELELSVRSANCLKNAILLSPLIVLNITSGLAFLILFTTVEYSICPSGVYSSSTKTPPSASSCPLIIIFVVLGKM